MESRSGFHCGRLIVGKSQKSKRTGAERVAFDLNGGGNRNGKSVWIKEGEGRTDGVGRREFFAKIRKQIKTRRTKESATNKR